MPIPSVLAAYAALPLHLRRHLGPKLAQRFLALDDADTAATIRNMIERAPGDPGEELNLLTADMALQPGETETGSAQLSDIANNDGPLAPEAVARLVDLAIDDELPSAESVLH